MEKKRFYVPVVLVVEAYSETLANSRAEEIVEDLARSGLRSLCGFARFSHMTQEAKNWDHSGIAFVDDGERVVIAEFTLE